MGHTLENPEENSLFFHPYFVEQETADLQQELVMIFNKIIDISSEDELQSAAKDMARVALISPNLALTKAVYEGVKSVGHSKSICCVSVYSQTSTNGNLSTMATFLAGSPRSDSCLTLSVPIVTNGNFLLTISIHYHEMRL